MRARPGDNAPLRPITGKVSTLGEKAGPCYNCPLCRSTSIGPRFWWGSGRLAWGGG